MEIIRCEKGHFYDAEQSRTCPTCARENAGGGNDFVFGTPEPKGAKTVPAGIGETMPIGGGSMGGAPVSAGVGETMPIGGVGATMPAAGSVGATVPVGGASAPGVADYSKTVPITPNINMSGADKVNSKVEAYSGVTVPVGFDTGASANAAPVSPVYGQASTPAVHATIFNPVVGWLVCIEGPAKGTDFRIHSQYNYIGRALNMDICIPGDDHISAERAGIIAYDNQEKMFSFGPGSGHNLVRVNGKMVMNAVELQPYDELTLGVTKLLFIPLCGERFDWNGK